MVHCSSNRLHYGATRKSFQEFPESGDYSGEKTGTALFS